jgi:arsenate reductase
MAETFLKGLAGEKIQVESAGLDPKPIHPLVIEVMREAGYDLSNKTSDSVFDFYKQGRLYDFIITVCDSETEAQCPVFAGLTKRLQWPFPDPEKLSGTRDEKLKDLREIRDQIKLRVMTWLKEIQ